MSTRPFVLNPLIGGRSNVEQSIAHSQTKVKQHLIKKESLAEKVLDAFPELIPGENKLDKGISKAIEPPEAVNKIGENLLVKPEQAGKEIGEQAQKSVEGSLSDLWKGLGKPLTRIGKVLAGAIIIIFGLYLLVKILSPEAASTGVTVAGTAGRGAKAGAKAAAPHAKNAALAVGYAVQPR